MLSDDQKHSFHNNGFLIIGDVIPEAMLARLEEDILERIDEMAAYLRIDISGVASDIDARMLALESRCPGASLIFTHSFIMTPGLFNLWSESHLVDIAQSLIGPDIDGHPFWTVRPKPPNIELFAVPWHQDSAYLYKEAIESQILTFWIPIRNVTANSGGMEFACAEHRNDHELLHIPHEQLEFGYKSWYLEIPYEIAEHFNTENCIIKRGSCIVFSQFTPHRSLLNTSQSCRWSVDLRYINANAISGVRRASIPFRRGAKAMRSFVEEQKAGYMQQQLREKRDAWHHGVENAIWKERWIKKTNFIL
ncbi:phytanoyl-CoA dioxygenase family protein [Methylotuvimicrobium buryatense]|uniref:Mitomycin antibiotic biosynthesis protein n=1 Tax=Methylotuvimicrobium buryatense TaxID=95641 RepID=A0A4P9UTG2_METBY|nr:phytanoyl-CoA dioxygenase family protein [Methylotuvimicrobium buryatense]QCW83873.1 hypothetical protein EQU24_17720 [Methylotuvimicrobium buryatense]